MQIDICNSLSEGKSLGEEGDQTVTDWPLADRLMQDGMVREDHYLDVVMLSQAGENALHWRSQGLQERRGGGEGGR